ncbi:DoxX family protein [Phenylobacterium sp.]|jgi:putative oxidoreductase|uniref:DoxX family protein n=1 Tax=Phenylobacterium sp. TaxID=1871053 RepID=UPI002F93C78F
MQARTVDYGIALLRVSLGAMFLAHSVLLKVLTFGMEGTSAYFVGLGLPGWAAYLVVAAEIVGGGLLVLGVAVRVVALALSPILLGALFMAHLKNGWVFTAAGGGWEYPAYLFVLCVAQSLLGAGAFALSPRLQRGPKLLREVLA